MWRESLIRFAGIEGFASLLRRAVALARDEVPSLHGIQVARDGRLEGFDSSAHDASGDEAAVVITAHLVSLLVSFIGEPLTMRLVLEAWPGTSLGTENFRNREQ